MSTEKVIILATGGTFDKVYYDALSDYRIGDPQASKILEQAGVGFDYDVETLIRKDSLDITDDDQRRIREWVETNENRRFVITHGTDTMVETAKALGTPSGKTIVLTRRDATRTVQKTPTPTSISASRSAPHSRCRRACISPCTDGFSRPTRWQKTGTRGDLKVNNRGLSLPAPWTVLRTVRKLEIRPGTPI